MLCSYVDKSPAINNNLIKSSTNSEIEQIDDETMKFSSTTNLIDVYDESEIPSTLPNIKSSNGTNSGYSWLGTALSSLLLVVLICAGLFFGRTYVKSVLTWLEYQNGFVAVLIFIFLFTLVSFPFLWGYILLNIVAGYLYGFLIGLLIVMVAVLIGTAVAHLVLRRWLHRLVTSKLEFNGILKATLMVMGGPNTFKVVAITRLTPIPFGLQNAIFAVSPIGSGMYLLASMLGLFPTQAINAYIGSTLRSMEDVLNDAHAATTGYIVLAVQVVISICLMVYLVHRAKQLLRQVMVESGSDVYSHLTDSDGIGSSSSSSTHQLISID
ncbi:hypothetical protein CHUAL_011465 [Chamberlinius hualienensis]